MRPLKDQLRAFRQGCEDDRQLRARGYAVLDQPYHMWLTGNPGTGKTTVARLLFELLKSAGVIASDAPFVEFKASHMEGSALGEAREKMQAKIDGARGGVLFADEAHNLTQHKDNIYGQQAASQLMDCLQDGGADPSQRVIDPSQRVIVIYAGYPEKMRTLMESDPGYQRRVSHRFELPDYTPLELAQIFVKKAESLRRSLGEGVTAHTIEAIVKQHTTPEERSSLNGTIAEDLLRWTDAAMRDRLRPTGFVDQPYFTWADVQSGAERAWPLVRTA